MAASITVFFDDPASKQIRAHMIKTDARGLLYDDPWAEPIEVRQILKRGLVIREPGPDPAIPGRTGEYIPPHRIRGFEFSDDFNYEGVQWLTQKTQET